MDPSLINNRTRRSSIVKEAPLARREWDDRPPRSKSKNNPRMNPKCVTKCHENVTSAQSHLSPPFGGAAQAGGGL